MGINLVFILKICDFFSVYLEDSRFFDGMGRLYFYYDLFVNK